MSRTKTLPVLHQYPTASKSALLLSPCIRWADTASKWYDENIVDRDDNVARNEGIDFHTQIDDFISHRGALTTVGSNVDKWFRKASEYYLQDLKPRCEWLRSEVAIAINWFTSEAVELQVTGRKYPHDKYPAIDGWQFGTADIVAVLKTGELYVADWKTGGSDGAEDQLKSLACGFQRLTTVSMSGQVHYPRNVIISTLSVNEHGVWPDEREVPYTELNVHKDSMEFVWRDITDTTRPQMYVPGIHCTQLYCPHLAYCGAINEAVTGIAYRDDKMASNIKLDGFQAGYGLTDTPRSDDEAGYVMSILSAAKRQTKYLETKLKDYVANGGKVVAGGWVWGDGNNGFRWRKDRGDN